MHENTKENAGECTGMQGNVDTGSMGCVCIPLHSPVFPLVMCDGDGLLGALGCFEGVSMPCAFSFPVIN